MMKGDLVEVRTVPEHVLAPLYFFPPHGLDIGVRDL